MAYWKNLLAVPFTTPSLFTLISSMGKLLVADMRVI
jgi:hypothetical protein